MNETILVSSLRGLDDFLLYLVAAVALLAVFVWIYVKVTPYREIQLIRDGNVAAACSLGGAILGFVIPLASAITHSVAFVDMLLWGAIALVIQLVAFFGARMLVPTVAADIPADRRAVGVFVGTIALAGGILNAAAMSY